MDNCDCKRLWTTESRPLHGLARMQTVSWACTVFCFFSLDGSLTKHTQVRFNVQLERGVKYFSLQIVCCIRIIVYLVDFLYLFSYYLLVFAYRNCLFACWYKWLVFCPLWEKPNFKSVFFGLWYSFSRTNIAETARLLTFNLLYTNTNKCDEDGSKHCCVFNPWFCWYWWSCTRRSKSNESALETTLHIQH